MLNTDHLVVRVTLRQRVLCLNLNVTLPVGILETIVDTQPAHDVPGNDPGTITQENH